MNLRTYARSNTPATEARGVITNLISGLIGYGHLPKKPSLN